MQPVVMHISKVATTILGLHAAPLSGDPGHDTHGLSELQSNKKARPPPMYNKVLMLYTPEWTQQDKEDAIPYNSSFQMVLDGPPGSRGA